MSWSRSSFLIAPFSPLPWQGPNLLNEECSVCKSTLDLSTTMRRCARFVSTLPSSDFDSLSREAREDDVRSGWSRRGHRHGSACRHWVLDSILFRLLLPRSSLTRELADTFGGKEGRDTEIVREKNVDKILVN